ncbi:ER membrane protein complex subunit 7 homolog [Drosophila biarmipes]|uniref:ER membrane protein complex subunit 7 homolog n=1 Tax=Drosophila biarmipes TaxID=125945 RepID=UPI0007E8B45C|nr:ER membrane protein complex subunit 7 homolog [Drosophila biarmipes]
MYKIIVILSIVCLSSGLASQELTVRQNRRKEDLATYTIEGVILKPDRSMNLPETWFRDITLSINGGEIKGFVRLDGRFLMSGVPNGSHILEVQHPDIYFQQVRVEITGKGKYRARKVNYIQPSLINQVPYPLRLPALARRSYFKSREQWCFLDVILNPMVLLMVMPLLLMLAFSMLIKDPETKKELDSIQFPKLSDMPDFTGALSTILSGKKRLEAEEMVVPKKSPTKRQKK